LPCFGENIAGVHFLRDGVVNYALQTEQQTLYSFSVLTWLTWPAQAIPKE